MKHIGLHRANGGAIKRHGAWAFSFFLVASLFAGTFSAVASISPDSLTAVVAPGDSITETKTVFVPPAPPKADVMFAFDLTGSMSGIINTAKSKAGDILTALGGLSGVDVQTGVMSYMDYPATYDLPALEWDFENSATTDSVSTFAGSAQVPWINGLVSQTGGGPAEILPEAPEAGTVHLTRYLGVYYPYIEFSGSFYLGSLQFQHMHNHNPGYPTYPSYDVQLQLSLNGGPYTDIGSPLNLSAANYGATDTIPIDTFVPSGTHRIRWMPRNLAFGSHTGTEFFAINDLTLNYAITYGNPGCGDYAYNLDQAITDDDIAVAATINGLVIGCGGDGPQDYTRIFYESYADSGVAWRDGARRILVNFGDAVPHDFDLNEGVPGKTGTWSTGGDPGRDEVMFTSDDLDLQTVLADMATEGVVLLEAHTYYSWPEYWNYWTDLTGGAFFTTTSLSLVDDVVDAITAALEEPTVTGLHFEASTGFETWLTSVTPPSQSGPTDTEYSFDIEITVPAGTPPGVYEFTISALDDVGVNYGYQAVAITVNAPPVADPNGPYYGDEGSPVSFDGTGSYDPDGDPLTYDWDFGDGSPVALNAGPTPNHTYDDNGVYDICLTVTDPGGLSDTKCASTKPMDVVFALDSSGSMGWNDPSGLRLAAAKSFVDMMDSSQDQAGVVSWDGGIDFTFGLSSDFATVKSRIDLVNASGGTNLNAGLNAAIALLDSGKQPGASWVIIFLSNGQGTYTFASSGGPAADAASKGYVIYSIGLGPSTWTAALTDMATATGGQYYPAPTAENLQAIFDDIFEVASGKAFIANVAPTAIFNAPSSVDEGDDINLSLTGPYDPSNADTAAGFEYAFDCDDGTGYSAWSSTSTATCPTDDNGLRTVNGKIRDKDGGVTEYMALVTINNVPPTATFNAPTYVIAGDGFSLSLTDPYDPSSVDTAAGFDYDFDCGSGYDGWSTGNSVTCSTDSHEVGDRAASGKIRDKDGGMTEYQATVTILPPSAATDSALCYYDREPDIDGQQFRLIFTPDMQLWPAYKLPASNPGQFFYNVFYTGTGPADFSITVPEPFETQGTNPVHVYTDVSVIEIGGYMCFEPDPASEIYAGDLSGLTGLSDPGGFLYVTVHLDYGDKGTTGYIPNATMDALDAGNEVTVLIPNLGDYTFSVNGSQTDSRTIQNSNDFKKIPGFGGLVLDGSANPQEGVTVDITLDSRFLGNATTDEDGWYLYVYKHTGKPAEYTVALPDYGGLNQSGILKANKFAEANFMVP